MRFGSKVFVTSGFYAGLQGTVVDYKVDSFGVYDYLVEGYLAKDNPLSRPFAAYINEKELRLI